jgi:hypothetical protein
MITWPPLKSLLSNLEIEPDQRLSQALQLCPTDRSIHDIHLISQLFQLSASLVRHPYAATLADAIRDMHDPGEYSSSEKQALGGLVVPSLHDTLRRASRLGRLTTGTFFKAWAQNTISHDGHKSRSYLIKYLMGDADTSEGSIVDAPNLYEFLNYLISRPDTDDDIDYVLAIENDRIVVRACSVLGDFAQRDSNGLIHQQRALLTHFLQPFGLFSSKEVIELEELLNDKTASEDVFQEFFERHPHFLRRGDYREVLPHPYLRRADSGPLIPDFILTDRELFKAAVVELKLPRAKLIRRQTNRERFGDAVTEARSQLMRYRDWFRSDANRRSLASSVGMEIYEPRLMVVIGRSSEFRSAMERQTLSDDHRDVEVVTYDDLLAHARRRQILIKQR